MSPTYTADLIGFLFGPLGLPSVLILLAWLGVAIRRTGGLRRTGAVLAALFAIALWWSGSAWEAGSNIWPLPILLWTAVALGLALLSWIIRLRSRQNHERKDDSPEPL